MITVLCWLCAEVVGGALVAWSTQSATPFKFVFGITMLVFAVASYFRSVPDVSSQKSFTVRTMRALSMGALGVFCLTGTVMDDVVTLYRCIMAVYIIYMISYVLSVPPYERLLQYIAIVFLIVMILNPQWRRFACISIGMLTINLPTMFLVINGAINKTMEEYGISEDDDEDDDDDEDYENIFADD